MTPPGTSPGEPAVTLADIERAASIIAPVIIRTPLLPAWSLRLPESPQLRLKAENLQRTGSFKIRGALFRLSRAVEAGVRRPVIAASAGNHAQGVAFAAQRLGLECTIVMPNGASLAKIAATERLGAAVLLEGETFDDAVEAARAVAAERDWTLIPAFDDPDIIAGQGTVGLEIVESEPQVGAVLVPIGGGGLAAGVATAVKALRPQARIIGVQAAANPSLAAARAAGKPVTIAGGRSIADGIAVKQLGALPYEILDRLLDDYVVVDEDEIVTAMAALLERAKLVVEGAGAVAVAAVMAGRVWLPDAPAVAVISGGNVDINLVARVIHYGLTRAGRYLFLKTRVLDRPGELRRLLGILAELGANLLDVSHHRQGLLLPVNEVQVEMTVETRDFQHCQEILDRLRQAGYSVEQDELPGPPTESGASPE